MRLKWCFILSLTLCMIDSPHPRWLAFGSTYGERESWVAAQRLPGAGSTFWVCMELSHRDSTLSRALLSGLVCPGFSRYLLLEDTISPQTPALSLSLKSTSEWQPFQLSLLKAGKNKNKTKDLGQKAREKVKRREIELLLDQGHRNDF